MPARARMTADANCPIATAAFRPAEKILGCSNSIEEMVWGLVVLSRSIDRGDADAR